ncbi:MAG: hypothetical protein NT118_15235, partial [Lentisphaerae bacterium]|nr:hypothetical protein [Lentisphaerota bacterium]
MNRRLRMPRMKRYSKHNIDPSLEPLMALWTCRTILNSGWTPKEVFGKYDRRDVITDILDADLGE